jgi:aryl-alcohol dehydrogenase-like predicted oxidoreductase
MKSRRLGSSTVELSPITFGSMRLQERSLDDAAWDRLLCQGIELGVTTLHVSSEYEGHARFCALSRGLSRYHLQYIVKVAEPHFGDQAFDRAPLGTKVDAHLAELATDRLDVVPWMWRGDLKDEAGRLAGFARQHAEVGDAFAELRAAGKIGAVAPFPYSSGFASVVFESRLCEGITVYLNPVEQEMQPQIARAAAVGMGTIAIRPLAAGKALAATPPAECVRSVLAEAGVASTVVSYSSIDHLRELIAAVG